METDESIQVNGKSITARDLPGRQGFGGTYRKYEVADQSFDSLDDAKTFANAAKPTKAKTKPAVEPEPAKDIEPAPAE